MSAPRPRAAFVTITTLFWLVMTALATATMWPIYQDRQFIILAVVVGLVGAAVAVLGSVFRWAPPIILGLMVAIYFVLGVPLAVPSQAIAGVLPTVNGLGTLAAAASLSWKQLVTIDLPVGTYQALLVPAFILVLLCSCLGLSIALRVRRAEFAALLPAGVFVVGNLLGSVTEFMPVVLAAALLVTILFWFGWRAWYFRRQGSAVRGDAREAVVRRADHRRVGWSAITGTIVIVALAGSLAAAAVTYLPPETSRQVIRSQIQQPFNPRDYSSPLSGFRSYWQDDRVDETMLTVTGLPSGARVRIATLDSYDGVVFRVGTEADNGRSGDFTRVASRVDQSAVVGESYDTSIIVGDYADVWLPTVGAVETAEFLGDSSSLVGNYFYNSYSGTAVMVGGVGQGDQYRLRGVQPTAVSSVADLVPGTDPISVTGVPAQLTSVLSGWVTAEDSPGEQLADALTALRSTGYISHGIGDEEALSSSGHSQARIAELFSSTLMIGDDEQYAVAAALIARVLGFPSRVVMGFAGDDGTTEFRGSDIAAWIEVQTPAGWVGIDPVPAVRELPEDQVEEPTVVPRPQSVVQPPKDIETTVPEQRSLENAQETQQDAVDPLLQLLLTVARVAGIALLVLLILLAPFLTVIAAKVQRRRRRRSLGDARSRVQGAWAEYRDAAVDGGLQPAPALTRQQIAASIGSSGALQLAELTDRAVFAPEDSSEYDAHQAWSSVDLLVDELGEGRTRWQRLRASVSLRSLGGDYHGQNRFPRKRRK